MCLTAVMILVLAGFGSQISVYPLKARSFVDSSLLGFKCHEPFRRGDLLVVQVVKNAL